MCVSRRMIKKSLIYLLAISSLFYACSSSTTGSKSSKKKTDRNQDEYYEDLASLRPKYSLPKQDSSYTSEIKVSEENYPDPASDITESLQTKLDSIDILRNDVSFVDGYTILVYSGTSSGDAKLTRGKLRSIETDFNPSLKYDEPNFKVKVGRFYSRLEAQETYSMIKSEFPKAILIPERIYLNSLD